MSIEYDKYLVKHKEGVKKAYLWIKENIPDIVSESSLEELGWTIYTHDSSKTSTEEYDAYDHYFYGRSRSYEVVNEFQKAWLHHIHNNPHHWQYYVLINDDPEEGEVILDMPEVYILEMICDWWSFSINSGDLASIFSWYSEHKDYMKLSEATRTGVEKILAAIKDALEVKTDETT